MINKTTQLKDNIVFFDGYCVLCNGLVDFLIRIDKKNRLKFSTLQGETAIKFLDEKYLSITNTIVFMKSENIFFTKSDAVLEIFKTIGKFWVIFYMTKIIPRFIRDALYNFIAKHRFKIFGKRESCRLPTENEKTKILP